VSEPKLRTRDVVIILAIFPLFVVCAFILLLLLPIIIPYVFVYKLYLRLRFELRWGRAGRRILLVYSRSPNWQEYIEHRWLPDIGSSLVTLDWSDRAFKPWPKSLEAKLFKAWKPSRDYNPLAILFPLRGTPRVVLLRRAFLAYKHGKPQDLENAEREIYEFAKIGGQL
jgi:hypothetical protein